MSESREFFFTLARISMVLISIIPTYKMRYCKLKISFWFTKKHFFRIRKFFEDKMRVRSKFFPHFLEKIEKFKLSLSKQHNKMLKMISEMRKNQKKSVAIKLGKFSWKKFPEISRIPGIPRIFGISGIFRDSWEVF